MSITSVAVFGASQVEAGGTAYTDAVRLGRLLAEAGLTVLSGGYGGVMEAVSQGAARAGGSVIGVTAPAMFPGRPGANRWVTEERPHNTMTERIHHLVTASDAAIALTGSIGTLTELMVAWNVGFVTKRSGGRPKPLVTVGEPWGSLVPVLTRELATDASMVHHVDTIDEAVEVVHREAVSS